jgi:hypothetical protein
MFYVESRLSWPILKYYSNNHEVRLRITKGELNSDSISLQLSSFRQECVRLYSLNYNYDVRKDRVMINFPIFIIMTHAFNSHFNQFSHPNLYHLSSISLEPELVGARI